MCSRGSAAAGVNIQGADELNIEHDSVMLEGGNTSFQVHLQVDPEAFARYYNVAQVMTAPVLAASVNSPLLFGRRLWAETRIALFQQSIDTRRSTPQGIHPRGFSGGHCPDPGAHGGEEPGGSIRRAARRRCSDPRRAPDVQRDCLSLESAMLRRL
jgi:hypothetical protein